MEQKHSQYHFFLRPRRFGKSLAVSVMEYYYGRQHKADFDSIFGKYYIGQHPTPLANKYLVLKFDFSGIETSTLNDINFNFSLKVKTGILTMIVQYPDRFGKEDMDLIENQRSASQKYGSRPHPQKRAVGINPALLLVNKKLHKVVPIAVF